MFVLQPPDPDPYQPPRCVLYFHSNGTDIGGARGEAMRLCFELNSFVVLPEYPGYGLWADDVPSVYGVDEACLYAFQYANDELDVLVENIVIFGRSIGTGPACRLAAHVASVQKDVGAVILVTPFFERAQDGRGARSSSCRRRSFDAWCVGQRERAVGREGATLCSSWTARRNHSCEPWQSSGESSPFENKEGEFSPQLEAQLPCRRSIDDDN